MVGVCRSTIVRRAGKLNIDLTAQPGRCLHTVDIISGQTVAEQRKAWLVDVAQKLVKVKKPKVTE
jgi:hypothetical protein